MTRRYFASQIFISVAKRKEDDTPDIDVQEEALCNKNKILLVTIFNERIILLRPETNILEKIEQLLQRMCNNLSPEIPNSTTIFPYLLQQVNTVYSEHGKKIIKF